MLWPHSPSIFSLIKTSSSFLLRAHSMAIPSASSLGATPFPGSCTLKVPFLSSLLNVMTPTPSLPALDSWFSGFPCLYSLLAALGTAQLFSYSAWTLKTKEFQFGIWLPEFHPSLILPMIFSAGGLHDQLFFAVAPNLWILLYLLEALSFRSIVPDLSFLSQKISVISQRKDKILNLAFKGLYNLTFLCPSNSPSPCSTSS